jgi:hypothetical protein
MDVLRKVGEYSLCFNGEYCILYNDNKIKVDKYYANELIEMINSDFYLKIVDEYFV